MSSRIVVTGLGIITAAGRNIPETFDALKSSRSGIRKLSILDTVHRDVFVAGEIGLTLPELVKIAGVDPGEPWTRTAILAVIAASEAIKDAQLSREQLSRTGLISATTVGGMDRSELFYKEFLESDTRSPYIDTHHAGNSTEHVATFLGIGGFISTVSTACSSSLNSLMFGARLIQQGLAERVVAGGTDALSKFTLNGFNSLMILDKEHCRPFDASRTGLNLGEGAAYLVLEKEERAKQDGRRVYAVLSGYANANDAFHQTASSEEGTGPYLSMQHALKKASLKPSDIDYINVHGTGTDNNDLTEGRAMLKLFGNKVPPFSSTKAFTGHTLGAAGAVEAIFSILALQHGMMWPNINFKTAIPELKLEPVTELQKKNLTHVLTNSFGFGGNDSSLVFSNPEVLSSTQDIPSETGPSGRKTAVYIEGIGALAPQETLETSDFLGRPVSYNSNYLTVVSPEYRNYIEPKVLRRMSAVVRMSVVAATTALQDAGVNVPDAIITGTGMGCQADTEKFLNAMIDNDESLLNPTAFIQSTHNTMGAQIALRDSNHNYNVTFVHRTFSFESALLDGVMHIRENPSNAVLVGGIDEITEESWKIKSHIDYYTRGPVKNMEMLHTKRVGAQAGESASFFVLKGEKTAHSYAEVVGVKTLFRPDGEETILESIRNMLSENRLSPEDIGFVLMGYNGDGDMDDIYETVGRSMFQHADIGYFKHLCGEHDTASAFATWIAARILKEKKVPAVVLKENKRTGPPSRILIYNHFRNINHSLVLLQQI